MHLKMNTDSAHQQQQQQSESTNNKSSTQQQQQQTTPAAEDKLALEHPMSFPHSSTSLHTSIIYIYIHSIPFHAHRYIHNNPFHTSTTPMGSIHSHTHTCSSSTNIHPSLCASIHTPYIHHGMMRPIVVSIKTKPKIIIFIFFKYIIIPPPN